ncbi:MAG: phosphoribosylformylglycinamidine synthase subunit PurS [Candidatus Delongbacteria bacterium]|nr:phosphoribosylformylglycinamidine synthase subunit PurS [bacterium]MBL7033038.1 phosphoribosylformylglycinamidine synthase subunit PurS [Candidatus Delongbacteria bacterium]
MKSARLYISLKPDILDPQGKTVHHALETLGFDAVASCRVGKYIELAFPDLPTEEITRRVGEMCERLLVNPVMETWRVEVVEE